MKHPHRQTRPLPTSSTKTSSTKTSSRRPQASSNEAEAELFLRAVEALERVPDKDTAARQPDEAMPRRPSRRRPLRRASKDPDCVLDLHGKKAAEARTMLTHFVERARHHGERTVLVITGKGLRSPGGIAVIKEELERWARQEGTAYLKSWSEAPRHLGGRGAYVLHLRH